MKHDAKNLFYRLHVNEINDIYKHVKKEKYLITAGTPVLTAVGEK